MFKRGNDHQRLFSQPSKEYPITSMISIPFESEHLACRDGVPRVGEKQEAQRRDLPFFLNLRNGCPAG